jgi:glycosyltransferase involved in cell wall biosynthesis
VRIGFDATPLATRGAGVARYTLELLRALRDCTPEIELRLMYNQPPVDAALATELNAIPRVGTPRIASRQVWMQAALPLALARQRLDVCHFTNFDVPLLSRTPAVVTLHDMSLLTTPELHPRRRVVVLTPLLRLAARRARAVACPSESARRDAIEVLTLDPDKVHVLPPAVSPQFRPLGDAAAVAAACASLGLEPGFVLFLGTIEPRKNLVRLARAYSQRHKDGFDKKLVICGSWGWKSSDLRPQIADMGIAADVLFTGYVPDDTVVALLNGAGAFVYPSLYEGFGMPIVEALACGVPVVTSNRGATAEVAGNAAVLVDPTNDDAIAAGLRVALDPNKRDRLRAAGLERAATFSRASAAAAASAIYERVAGG